MAPIPSTLVGRGVGVSSVSLRPFGCAPTVGGSAAVGAAGVGGRAGGPAGGGLTHGVGGDGRSQGGCRTAGSLLGPAGGAHPPATPPGGVPGLQGGAPGY